MSHEIHITEDNNDEPKQSNIFVRLVVILGMLFVLFLIAFAIVRFVPRLISSLGQANVSLTSLFNPKDKLALTLAQSEVKSGDMLHINWVNNTGKDGVMMWSYDCVSGVTVEYNSIDGIKPITCNTLFPLPQGINSYGFIIRNTNQDKVTLPITVSLFTPDLKTTIEKATSSVEVLGGGQNQNTTPSVNTSTKNSLSDAGPRIQNGTQIINTQPTKTVQKTTTTKTQTSVTRTPADLSIALVQVGRVTSNGTFEETTNFNAGDHVVVRFNVGNIGGTRSGDWTLSANLPTSIQNEQSYVSGNQTRLNPGDIYAMTLAFDSYDPSQNTITFRINANDNNQSNNTLSINVRGTGTTNNTNTSGTRPDLTVRILGTGVMDRNTNQIYYSNSLTRSDKVAVKFEIENKGGSSADVNYTVTLPSSSNSSYSSGNIGTLGAGQKAEFIIGFENPYTGSNTISIQVDPNNNISETDEGNNTASQSIYVNNN